MKPRNRPSKKQWPAGGGPIAKRIKATTKAVDPSSFPSPPQAANAAQGVVLVTPRRHAEPEESQSYPGDRAGLAGGAGVPARNDDEAHEATCAKLRAAAANMEMNAETVEELIRAAREPGWPDALDLAREAATTPRGRIYDAADGQGGRGHFFRSLLPGSWRHHIELGFDVQLLGGVQKPSMLVRQAAHIARVGAQMFAGSPHGAELRVVADLFERYPAQAVDYAAEWAATFNARVGSSP